VKETTVPKQPANDADTKGAERDASAGLKQASRDLKQRIIDEKRRNDMPIDAALGDPKQEARAADGSLDLPDVEDE
jgi:hypothetical protein